MSYWTFGISGGLVALGILLWLGSGYLCFQNWSRRRRKSTAFLECLRLIIITGLLFTLFKPEHVRVIEETEPPAVVVLSDMSGSMTTLDVDQKTNVVTRVDWLEQELRQDYWSSLNNGALLHMREFSSSNTNTAGTDLDEALKQVIEQHPRLKAVILLSDGDWNQGGSPSGASLLFREQKIPVYTSTIGSETALPDLSIERVDPPAYGLVGEQVAIPFRVRSTLPESTDVQITIQSEGETVAERSLNIPANTDFQEAIVWSPISAGDYSLTLDLPLQPDERIQTNNKDDFNISIRSETLRILIVDTLPRWEYRYLRNALDRDPGVDMNCILFHPGMTPGEGPNYLSTFPGTKELISEYDVIFLGDVPVGPGGLSATDAELIKGLVENQSSGLVLLPGSQGHHLSWKDSSLGDLLPVSFETERQTGIGLRNESTLELSTLGAGHWLTRFDNNPTMNEAIWKRLPGFYWSTAVEKSRPGSEVLAVHSNLRNDWGRMPLLVTRSAGSGKVLFMGSDSAWRWRRGVEDKYHYRFWSQIARWMAHQRHLAADQGIRLSFSPENPKVGDTVFLQSTVMDSSGFPIERGAVVGTTSSPTGASSQLQFQSAGKGWGVFNSQFNPTEGGDYSVTVRSDEHDRKLETTLTISKPVIEKIGRPSRPAVLQEISKITLARSVSPQELPALVSEVSILPEPDPRELRFRLWASSSWGGLLLGLLAVYWIGRKLSGQL